MNLDRVTITGPNDLNRLDDLLAITAEFPFVEWGILASKSQEGSSRFPPREWINNISDGIPGFSLHLCGAWVRDLLIGKVTFPKEWLPKFRRIQLNFHDERTVCKPVEFANALAGIDDGKKQFIFQVDSTEGNKHLYSLSIADSSINAVPLFDVSGGAGVLPHEWPKPLPEFAYHGYAGGLGPQNLARQLPLIAHAAGEQRIWIDMETHVRSHDDKIFDLSKVRKCLEIAKPFVI